MSHEPEPFTPPSRENIEAVVRHLPDLESLAPEARIVFQEAATWDYHPAIEALLVAFHRNHFVQPYPWPKWQPEAKTFVADQSLLEHADLETCVKLITLHVRKERFCGGHIGEMIDCGHISAILRRLADLGRRL